MIGMWVVSFRFRNPSGSSVADGQPIRKRLQLVGLPEVFVHTVLISRVHLDARNFVVADRVHRTRREDELAIVDAAVARVTLDDGVVSNRAKADVVDADSGCHELTEEGDDL